MPPLSRLTMLVGIHQLHHLPWLRYLHKIATCDTFVVLDNIQFNKNGWQNRNKIKTERGEAFLSVPVLHRWAQHLDQVRIDGKQPWRRKHWGSLSNAYQRAPYFKDHEAFFRKVYEREWEKLNDLNFEILLYLVEALGIRTKIIRGSELDLRGEATERLVGICKELGASAYLTGAYAVGVYLDRGPFEREGIEVVLQSYECPAYPQLFPALGFLPELSIVDLLFNCGPKSLEVLLQKKGAQASEGKKT